jgi:hypothetical protein
MMGSLQVSPRIRPAVRLLACTPPPMLERKLRAFDFETRKNGAQCPLVWDESPSETTTPAKPDGV